MSKPAVHTCTPLPWRLDTMGLRILADIEGFEPTPEYPEWVVAQCSTYCGAGFNLTHQQRANAAHIVRSVNSHDALVAALRGVLKRHCGCYSNTDEKWHSDTCYVPAAEAALKLAEEGL